MATQIQVKIYNTTRPYNLYSIDTNESFLSRIGHDLRILPDFLLLSPTLSEIIKTKKANLSILTTEFYNSRDNVVKYLEDNKKKLNIHTYTFGELFLFSLLYQDRNFLSNLTSPNDLTSQYEDEILRNVDIFNSIYTLDDLFKNKIFNSSFENIRHKIVDYIVTYKRKLNIFLNLNHDLLIQQFDDLKPQYTTKIQNNKSRIQLSLKVNYDIFQLFNDVTMSQNIPFVKVDKFYKIWKNFKVYNKWLYTNLETYFINKSNVMYIKILTNLTGIKEENYTDVEIYFENEFEEKKNELLIKKLKLQEQIYLEYKEFKIKEYEVKQATKTKRKGKEKKETSEPVEEFNLTERLTKIDNDITNEMYDLEDKQFNEVNNVYIQFESSNDEVKNIIRDNISKIFKKDNLIEKEIQLSGNFYIPDLKFQRFTFLHLVMNDSLFNKYFIVDEHHKLIDSSISRFFVTLKINKDIVCIFNESTIETNDQRLINIDPKLDIYTSYLNIKILNTENEEEQQKVVTILAKFITLYKQNYEKIVKLYEGYFNDFTIFLTNENKELVSKTKSTLTSSLKHDDPELFPPGYARVCQHKPTLVKKKEKGAYRFPKDGGKYYVCKDKEFPYFGLKRNKTLQNKDKYPLIPCCYKKPQDNPNKLLYKYYHNDENLEEHSEGYDKYIYTTNKILPPGRYGYMINNVKNFFDSFSDKTKVEYLRRGTKESVNSILECLAEITKNTMSINDIREDLINYIKNIPFYQEAFLYTPEFVVSILENKKMYLDPRLFHHVLQSYFKCNFYIFSSVNGGTLSAPYHAYTYLPNHKDIRYKNTVLVYENHEESEYPKCELICEKSDIVYFNVFNDESMIINKIKLFYNSLYKNQVESIPLNFPEFKSTIINGGYDSFGKTRYITLKFPGGVVSIFTPPLGMCGGVKNTFPFNIKNNSSEVLKFLKYENITQYNKQKVKDIIIGLNVYITKFYFFIPLYVQQLELKSTFFSKTLPYSDNNVGSTMNQYNKFLRLARYIIEYVLFLFSTYYHKHQITEINSEVLKKFIDDNITIDSSFQYKDIPRNFVIGIPSLFKGKKLVIKDIVTLRKLIYTLKIYLRNNENEVINYKNYRYIQQYFKDVTDFNIDINSIIIVGHNNLIRFYTAPEFKYPLKESIKTNETSLLNQFEEFNLSESDLYILVFTAKWSKAHKDLEIIVNDNINFDLTVASNKALATIQYVFIDVDENKSLVQEFNVESVPTLMYLTITKNNIKILGNLVLTNFQKIEMSKEMTKKLNVIKKEI